MKGCRVCLMNQSRLTSAQSDLRAAARQASRWPDSPRMRDRVKKARQVLAEAQEEFDTHYEHDQLLITDHWTRRTPVA